MGVGVGATVAVAVAVAEIAGLKGLNANKEADRKVFRREVLERVLKFKKRCRSRDDLSSHWNRGHNLTVTTNRQFQKRRQLFIRTHTEPVSVAMRVSDPDCSPVGPYF